MATDCALDADGNLKNASDIEFFNSETDSHLIRRHGTNVEPEKRDKTGMCSFFRSNSIHDVFSFQVSEQIFSGGRDTISLRCASLIPDTIQVLMLVKQRLRLARISLQTDIL